MFTWQLIGPFYLKGNVLRTVKFDVKDICESVFIKGVVLIFSLCLNKPVPI